MNAFMTYVIIVSNPGFLFRNRKPVSRLITSRQRGVHLHPLNPLANKDVKDILLIDNIVASIPPVFSGLSRLRLFIFQTTLKEAFTIASLPEYLNSLCSHVTRVPSGLIEASRLNRQLEPAQMTHWNCPSSNCCLKLRRFSASISSWL